MDSVSNKKIVLIGNPNSGKSTLFNQLTGLNQKVGNFAGVTTERKSGICKIDATHQVEIIDLPGTYSIYPKSYDEQVVFDIISNPQSEDFPDLIVIVVDASNLKRNLLLFSQIYDTGLPCILCLNMIDVANRDGVKIDAHKFENILHQCPVLSINSKQGIGIDELKTTIVEYLKLNKEIVRGKIIPIDQQKARVFDAISSELDIKNKYVVELLVHNYKNVKWLPAYKKIILLEILKKNNFDSLKIQTQDTIARYQRINEIYNATTDTKEIDLRHDITEKLDKVFTHKIFGFLILIGVFYLIFQSIFSWASYPMDLIDKGIGLINETLKNVLPEHLLVDLLTEGVISGLGGLLVFVPQIAFLFLFISILEETGYMSRVMFLMDNFMKPFGLNGKSIVPLFSGAACAIPAIMASRNIGSYKERLITIFITPLISCSARIPVYTIIIALVIPSTNLFGVINTQGLVMLMLYVMGFVVALLTALMLKFIIKSNEKSFFILEMPDYKFPKVKNILQNVFEKVKAFVFGAGKIIIAISVILWFLSSFGFKDEMKNAELEVKNKYETGQLKDIENIDTRIEASKLEASFAGKFGKLIEPVIRPLGFDWKIGIALLTSFAAREVFVGTISTIYSIGNSDDNITLKEKLAQQIDEDGKPYFNLARGLSLLLFYAFALQCMSTLAIVKKETNSWKIVFYQLLYLSFLAYMSAFVAFNMFSN